jgi:hypothetical protein
MLKDQDTHIVPNVHKSLESLNEAILLFENFLGETASSAPGDYYRARNLLKQGEAAFQEALKNAKKLLGPMPAYATEEFRSWRAEFLTKHKILTHYQELENCRLEFHKDEFLSGILSQEEIDALLNLHFQSQQEGKRKLENLKIRIALDKLNELLIHAHELQKQALVKHQQNP